MIKIVIKKIPNQLITSPLQQIPLANYNSIALHHMANHNWTIKDVESYHVNTLGWRAIGYNYWVGFDGSIYEGRGLNLGAGVENQNGKIISVGFQGDYENVDKVMPDVQFNSGIDIINYIKNKVPTIKFVGGHKDFMATLCPGKYFPLEEIKKGIKRSDFIMFNDVPEKDWAYSHIKKLKEFGIINGDENNNFEPDRPITRREAAVMVANALTYIGK